MTSRKRRTQRPERILKATNNAPSPIKLIVGLGNPGAEYERTPHNAGFWFVDEITRVYGAPSKYNAKFHSEVARVKIAGHECHLLKPMQFMNRSGWAVNAFVNYYKIDGTEVMVAHDELDFPAGKVRLKKGGGHGGHNGLRDIIPGLGKAFYRLRIGVGRPPDKTQITDYLLSRADDDVVHAVMRSIDASLGALETIISGDVQRAMLSLHTTTADAQE